MSPPAIDAAPPARRVSSLQGPGGVSRVRQPEQTQALYEAIVSPVRVYPIVALSCKFNRADPPVSVERVGEVVWDTVPIYVIESRESRALSELLPDGLGVFNGAMRVWWPGVDGDSEGRWHPLVYDRSGEYGEAAVQRLAEVFAHRPPDSLEDLTEQQRTVLQLSAVPRPGEAPTARSAAVLPLSTRRDLRRLTSDLRSDRNHPVIVLTLHDSAGGPLFSPAALARGIDPNIPIYVLGTEDLCRRLAGALGEPLAVGGGDARIYWPGARAGADPSEHPRASATSDDMAASVERLVGALELSRPGVREHVRALELRLERTRGQAGDSTMELRDAKDENRALLARAESSERERDTANAKLAGLTEAEVDEGELDLIAGLDLDGRLHRLIVREWLKAVHGPVNRARNPLRYLFGPDFTKTVDELTGTPLRRIAWVAAMIGSGGATTLQGIDVHPLRESSSGSAPQVVRSRDGAKAWRGKLNGEGASRIHYWQRTDGLVEFTAVGVHDAIGPLA